MAIAVRRLTGTDAQAYRELRLSGLKEAPEAFGSSYTAESRVSEVQWRDKLSGERVFFGAFDGDLLVGSANFLQEAGTKQRHKAWLLGMYVTPEARGTGCGLQLIEALLAHAAGTDALQVQLGVGAYNAPAQRLYDKAGFRLYGTEPRALKVEDRFIDEHLMVKFLDTKEDE